MKNCCTTLPTHAKVLASPICGAGAENTVIDREVHTATLSAVSLRPKFKVLDVRVLPTRKGGSVARSMFSPPSRPFCVSEKRTEWFCQSHRGDQTMTTVNTTTTPKPGNLEAALRAILCEVAPGQRPYSTDSYLPGHLIVAAEHALAQHESAASQHAFNALSTAAWHCARGEPGQAISRMRRAQAHLAASMEGV